MSDRYKPNGTPLSEHERELLVILMEECAEVTQAASKLIRFGKENRPDSGIPNTETLGLEVGDLRAMMMLVEVASLIEPKDVKRGLSRKYERLNRFMQTQPIATP